MNRKHLTLTAALLLAVSASSASAGPADPVDRPGTGTRAPRPQAVRSITVRLMPAGTVSGPYRISTLTLKSCTVQVDEPARMSEAFQACLAAKPEREGCRTLTLEDGSKVRAVTDAGGMWDKAGCDQGKIRR